MVPTGPADTHPAGTQLALPGASYQAVAQQDEELRFNQENFELPEMSYYKPWWKRRGVIIFIVLFPVLASLVALAAVLRIQPQRAAEGTTRMVSKVAFSSCTQRFSGPNPIWEAVRPSTSQTLHLPRWSFL
jgi:hypothetical protein